MARHLQNRVLVVTGASSGIGAATAIEAGRSGMRVVLAARRRPRLEQVAEQVREAGGEALVVVADVADAGHADQLMARTLEKWDAVDALFVNAGFGWFRPLDEGHVPADDALWQVNYFGALRAIRRAAAVMKARNAGHILVCSSLVSRSGLPHYGTYAATKAALHGMAASMQLELEAHNVQLSCIYPGSTATEFHEQVRLRCGRDPASENTPDLLVQSARSVARRIIKCLRRPRPEVWPSRLDHAAAVLWTAFPRLRTFCFRFHARKAQAAWESLKEENAPDEATKPDTVTVGE